MSEQNRPRSEAALPPTKFGGAGMHRFAPTEKARDRRGTLRKLLGI